MYQDFFGLREAPFRITPNTEFFFSGGNRGAILDALLYAISQGEGIVKVTGEVGSGKTMLCRMLQARLPAEVLGVYLANPSVSPDEILHAIAHELELELPAGAGRLEAMQRITGFLLDCHSAKRQVVLFVEESQSMPIATLEEIRLLSNLETDRHKLLQIVLFGQPELDALLRKPEIRQLRERITHSFMLAPLAATDIGQYLNFRLRAAGYKGPDVFGPAVVKRIAAASAGLTRRVNLLGDKTLLAAFSESSHAVAPRHVRAAIRDSEFARTGGSISRWRWPMAAGGLAVAAILAALVFMIAREVGPTGKPAAAPAPAVPESAPPAPAPAALPQPSPEATRLISADASATSSTSPAQAPAVPAPVPVKPAAAAVEAAPAPAAPAPVLPAVPGVPAAPATAAPRAAASAASPAPAVPAAPTGRPLLDARLAATREWLAGATADTVSIQIMGAPSEEQLERQLRNLSKQVEGGQLYVFRTRAGTRPSLTVLYGAFGSRREAAAALAALPESIRSFSPHLRTVQGVRAEIAASGS